MLAQWVTVAAAVWVAAQPAAADETPLATVLARAATYVAEFHRQLSSIVAEEQYVQTVYAAKIESAGTGPARRVLKSDLLLLKPAGADAWMTLRDVFDVDGEPVRDRTERLSQLFLRRRPSSDAQIRRILDESSRYNIGPVVRNINFPTLALMFLHPQNQPRFEWKRGGTRRFGATLGVEVEFDEKARPTIVDKAGQGDLPAHGRFWIDPARGTVLRSETRFDFGGGAGGALVSAEYRPEPKLALWVPSEMHEEYTSGTRVDATARYSNFRKFSVSVDDVKATVAPEPPKP